MAATAIALGKSMAEIALASIAFTPRTPTRWHAITEPNFAALGGSCAAMTAKLGLKTTTDLHRNHRIRRLS
jgi:hypothetical protein